MIFVVRSVFVDQPRYLYRRGSDLCTTRPRKETHSSVHDEKSVEDVDEEEQGDRRQSSPQNSNSPSRAPHVICAPSAPPRRPFNSERAHSVLVVSLPGRVLPNRRAHAPSLPGGDQRDWLQRHPRWSGRSPPSQPRRRFPSSLRACLRASLLPCDRRRPRRENTPARETGREIEEAHVRRTILGTASFACLFLGAPSSKSPSLRRISSPSGSQRSISL